MKLVENGKLTEYGKLVVTWGIITEEDLENHDCKLSPDSGCNTCEVIQEQKEVNNENINKKSL